MKISNDNPFYLIFSCLIGILFLPLWWLEKLIPRNQNLWIFGAWEGFRYSDNSRALYEYVHQHCPDLHAVWVTRDSLIYHDLKSKGFPVVKYHSLKGWLTTLSAGYMFATKGYSDACIYCMHGIHTIMLWHGMPLKKIGADEMSFKHKDNTWKRIKTQIRRICFPYRFLEGEFLSAAPFFTPFLRSAFSTTPNHIWELGLPRNDRFFDTEVEELIRHIDKKYNHPTKILYMPTHRDACSATGKPFNPFEACPFDATAFEACLEQSNSVLIYKGHFFDAQSKGTQGASRIMTVNDQDYDDLYRFIKDVDVLLTDYSSIYFDFLLCRKPIILFPFDEADYIAKSRPFYFDYNLMEAPKVYSWKELAQCIAQKDFQAPDEKEIRRFNLFVDNQSCRRIVEKTRGKK